MKFLSDRNKNSNAAREKISREDFQLCWGEKLDLCAREHETWSRVDVLKYISSNNRTRFEKSKQLGLESIFEWLMSVCDEVVEVNLITASFFNVIISLIKVREIN